MVHVGVRGCGWMGVAVWVYVGGEERGKMREGRSGGGRETEMFMGLKKIKGHDIHDICINTNNSDAIISSVPLGVTSYENFSYPLVNITITQTMRAS